MTSVLTGRNMDRVIEGLSQELKLRLRVCWAARCDAEDKLEYPFGAFCRDVVQETVYRAEEGRDGNWDEFQGDFQFGDQVYDQVLASLVKAGWTKGLVKW